MDCEPYSEVVADSVTLPENPIHLLAGMRDDDGMSLDLPIESGALVVFLRHNGCTFTRELLAQLRERLPLLRQQRRQVIIVHMGTPDRGRLMRRLFELDGVRSVSDRKRFLYTAFNLPRGRTWQLLGPLTWWRLLLAGTLWRHGMGAVDGATDQLAGAFLIKGLTIENAWRPQRAAEPVAWRQLLHEA